MSTIRDDNGEKKELRAIISVNTVPIISRWDGMKWVSYEPQSQHLPKTGRQFLTTVTSIHPSALAILSQNLCKDPHLPSHQQCDGNSRTIRRRRTAWLHELPFGNLGGFEITDGTNGRIQRLLPAQRLLLTVVNQTLCDMRRTQ